MIEFAILWPMLLLLLFAGAHFSSYSTARSVALTAAQRAVTTERLHDAQPGTGTGEAEEFLQRAGVWLHDWRVDPPVRDEEAGTVSVTVHGDALPPLPIVTWTVEQTAHGTLEQFEVGP